MSVYYFLIVCIILGSFTKIEADKKMMTFFIIFIMIILVGFRNPTIGTDTEGYWETYADNVNNWYTTEFLFGYLVKIFQWFGCSPLIIQFLFALITYIPLAFIFTKYSKNGCLSLLIFTVAFNIYFFETMNIVRQSCSLPYILLTIIKFNNRKFIQGLVFFIIAIGFHNSSLLLIPVLLLAAFCHIKKRTYIIILVSSIVISLTISSIEIILEYSNLLSNIGFLNWDRWMGYNEVMADTNAKNINGLFGIMIPSSIFAYFVVKHHANDFAARVLGISVVINNILCILPSGTRAMLCAMAVITVYFPLIFRESKSNRILLISLTCGLILYLFFVRMPYMQHVATNWFSPYKFA